MALTIFYDGSCPLCVAEMNQLRQLNSNNAIVFEDILADDFDSRYPDIDSVKAKQILHARLDTGEILLGLDATVKAWAMVNKKAWLRVLRWPVIRIVADACYLFFARHRYRISWLLTGKSRCQPCESGQCEIKSK
ncbi:thiol-disulfide oxidoreductase DCC family protein [Veronia pacifica]|uniref:Thiol-disulfide oxidoreductase n=1 Tax=Veronia pacifica TaxID=1080227 RepID=A0A1C3EGC1_9GAMM|nr:DUF393 domain-containing protein [Veronia pacifica]ODA32278.1 thiol-disulfide oxidoreductase [Veronia pacifica]